jgi:hypothetical protein
LIYLAILIVAVLPKKFAENVFGIEGEAVVAEPTVMVGVSLEEYCSRIAFISILRIPYYYIK